MLEQHGSSTRISNAIEWAAIYKLEGNSRPADRYLCPMCRCEIHFDLNALSLLVAHRSQSKISNKHEDIRQSP